MAINIQSKMNYSYLFQGMSTSSSSGSNLNFLSDYMSIKNGSYGKLMKAYYSKGSNSSVSSMANQKFEGTANAEYTKNITSVQNATDKLKDAADTLLATGKEALFEGESVSDKDYEAVSQFVNSYNSVISSVDNLGNSSISNKGFNLALNTQSNDKLLAKVGITINAEDSSLKLDKEAFMKADLTTVKSLFQGSGSYAYRASAQSSLINFATDNLAAKSNTYTFNGTYGNNLNTGALFNSYF